MTRSRRVAGVVSRLGLQRVGASGHPTAARDAAPGDAEAQALSVTHWFESEQDGDPYAATVRWETRAAGHLREG